MAREQVERIVIGEPRQPNGQPSENLARVQQFVNRWRKQRPDIPIEYYDERFTSVLAHQAMLDAGLKKKTRQDKALVDEITETIDAPKKQDKRKIFFNRKICGNKTTEKWNDGVAIKGVISWIEKILDEGDTIAFENYSQFAEEVLDIYQDICSEIAVKINYDPDAFNSVTIVEVFDK